MINHNTFDGSNKNDVELSTYKYHKRMKLWKRFLFDKYISKRKDGKIRRLALVVRANITAPLQ